MLRSFVTAMSPTEAVKTSVHLWIDLVRTHAGPQCETLLVITEADLIPSAVLTACLTQVETLQKEINSAGAFITSAKTGQGITEVFATAAQGQKACC
jgi:Ni2+-binding GTPase involved in maturation of urease and hydrogenase